jgi:hypothetical protein
MNPLADPVTKAIAAAVTAAVIEELRPAIEAAKASPWMRTKEAAAYLQMKPASFAAAVAAGRIPRHYVGGMPLYDRVELDQVIREGRSA